MATAKKAAAKKAPSKKAAVKHTATGLKQDRALVAAKQPHEVGYAAKKAGVSAGEVKTAVKSVGNSRKAVEKKLAK